MPFTIILSMAPVVTGKMLIAHHTVRFSIFYFLHFSFYCNMWFIQFNVYFNHHLLIFILIYITYIGRIISRRSCLPVVIFFF